jgi:hypothetical protein
MQHGDELRWVMDLEVEALDGHVEGDLLQGVRSGVEDAGMPADGFQSP